MLNTSVVMLLAMLEVALLRDKLGFNDAFNYKDKPDLKLALKKNFLDGIDIYFDNVGAEMLEVVVANMNTFGGIEVCEVIFKYTDASK
ncbi:Alcohol dehydrogenase superfamily, zinc-type [Parasponia andersonii]|uniref:Alcohol dehydrogenase superfamily, zinc-type n=1 Tax=Parasponia andersonii TaxID=3476 RepID=A0A2P5AS21_PARAD|nr:Alcohol dehydrogenase superfamily, zinc-type [Parasponia andersonii]